MFYSLEDAQSIRVAMNIETLISTSTHISIVKALVHIREVDIVDAMMSLSMEEPISSLASTERAWNEWK